MQLLLRDWRSALVATLIALHFLFFFAPLTPTLSFFAFPFSFTPAYLITSFLLFGILSSGIIWNQLLRNRQNLSENDWLFGIKHLLILFLPGVCVLAYGLTVVKYVPAILEIAFGLYVIAWGALLARIAIRKIDTSSTLPTTTETEPTAWQAWFRKQGLATLLFVVMVTGLFFGFGLSRIDRFAAVDEPLWTDGRIMKYWKSLELGEWEKTEVSDKPGITVALAAGAGLFSATPKDYRETRFDFNQKDPDRKIEDFYLAFRLPFLIVITLLLPIFYFLLERLVGRPTALSSYVFITLSPITIGISKIINPDSLLWIFTPLTLIAYFVFLKRGRFRYLILAGVFFGLALLTKYVANFLLIYFLGLTFLESLYRSRDQLSLIDFFKQSARNLSILVFVALATFWFLLPAAWVHPQLLFTSTIGSQAFVKVAPLFLFFILFLILDGRINHFRFTTWIVGRLSLLRGQLAAIAFGACATAITIVLINVWFGMSWIHFEHILSAPKTAFSFAGMWEIFLTNFYPLVFGLPPIALASFMLALAFSRRADLASDMRARITLYITWFILIFYLGSTVNDVTLITRYQIILYPLASILAGIGLTQLIEQLQKSGLFNQHWLLERSRVFAVPTLAGIFLVTSLATTPFPLSYASTLLPLRYHIDVKEMGAGSYEAAAYLNTLPDAENLFIWTDKDGVCKFFVGHCEDGLNFSIFLEQKPDYIVISSGRQSRTERMFGNTYRLNDPGLLRFDEYYTRTDPEFELHINGRPAHFVKAFSFKQ